MTIARSRSIDIETVTGECQWPIRRECDRSTFSWSASVRQQKSAYTSSPKTAARPLRSPSRLAAIAKFATPPGHEPIPSAKISVPVVGADSSPVSTMSRNTVPCTNTS